MDEALTQYLDDVITKMEATWAQLPVAEVFRHAQPIPLGVSADLFEGTRHIREKTRIFTSPEDAVEAALQYPCKERHVIILFGGPGAGKTSAMKWLARHFARRAMEGPDDTSLAIPLHIELPTLNTKEGQKELLANMKERQPSCVNPRPTLWLLDGLDAIAGSSVSPGHLLDSLKADRTFGPEDLFIVASRELTDVKGTIDRWPFSQRLTLKRLDRTQRNLWIAKYCPDAASHFERFIAAHPKAAGFLDIPLLFAMLLSAVADLQDDQRPFDCNKYSGQAGLFEGFTRYAIRRAVELDRLPEGADDDAALDYVEEAWWGALKCGHEDRFEVREAGRLIERASGMEWKAQQQEMFDRGIRILKEAGLTFRSDGRLIALHQQFAEFWAARHLAARLRRAIEGGWFEAELWDHYEEERLDPVVGQALAICASETGKSNLAERGVALLRAQHPRSVVSLCEHVGTPIVIAPLIAIVRDKGADGYFRCRAADALGKLGVPAAVEPLLAIVRDKSLEAAFRCCAADALGKLGDHRAVEFLIDVARDEGVEGRVRCRAAEALGKLGDLRAVELLIAIVRQHAGLDSGDTMRATEALVELADPRAARLLVPILRDKSLDFYTHSWAAQALKRLRDSGALDPLVAIVRDRSVDSFVRHCAAEALAKLGGVRAAEPLVDVLQNVGEDVDVRRNMAEVLAELGDARAVELLVATLRDKSANWYTRDSAARAMERLRDPRALKHLIEVARDEGYDSHIRRTVLAALGNMGDHRAVEPLLDVVRDKGEDIDIRCCAANTLRRLGNFSAVEPFIAIARDNAKDNRILYYAATTLGELGDPSAVGILIDIARDKYVNSSTRRCAAEALGKLEDPNAVQLLIGLAGDKGVDVGDRCCALDALGELGDHRAVEPLIQIVRDIRELEDSGAVESVISSAAEALEKLADSRTVEFFIDLARNKSVGKHARYSALAALGKLGDHRAVKRLINLLPEIQMWHNVAEALGILCSNTRIELIHQMEQAGVRWDLRRKVADRLGRRLVPQEQEETIRAQRENRSTEGRKENYVMVTMNNPVFNQCIVNIESNLRNMRQQIVGTSRDNDEVRKTIVDLEEALKATPPEHAEKAEAVSIQAKVLTEQASQSKPNRTFMEITKKGMIDAAKALASVVPMVLPLAKKLAELIIGKS